MKYKSRLAEDVVDRCASCGASSDNEVHQSTYRWSHPFEPEQVEEGGPGSGQKGHTTAVNKMYGEPLSAHPGIFSGGSHTPDPRAQAAFDKEQAELQPPRRGSEDDLNQMKYGTMDKAEIQAAKDAEQAAISARLQKSFANRKPPRETQLQKWHRRNSSGYD